MAFARVCRPGCLWVVCTDLEKTAAAFPAVICGKNGRAYPSIRQFDALSRLLTAFGAYGTLAHPQNGKIEERTSQIGVTGTESIEREAGRSLGELRPAFSSLLC